MSDVRQKTPSDKLYSGTPSAGILGGTPKGIVQKLKDVGDLRFYADYSKGSTTAQYSAPLTVTANSDNVQVAPHSFDGIVHTISTTGNVSPGGTKEYFMDSRQHLIRENGTLIGTALYIGTGTLPTLCKIRVWREGKLISTYGSNSFTLVGESENFAASLVADTTNVIVFASPITGVQEGDFYSILITSSTANALASINIDPPYTYACTFDSTTEVVTATGHPFTNNTIISFFTRTGTMAGNVSTTYEGYYFVANRSGDTFTLLDSNLAAVNISSNGSGSNYVSIGLYSAQTMVYAGTAPSPTAWRTVGGSITRLQQVAIPAYLYMQAPNFVALGDSLTAGYPDTMPYMNYLSTGTQALNTIRFNAPDRSYPNALGVLTGYSFQNAGIGGHTSQHMVSRFATDVSPFKPRFVLIMAGANDLSQLGYDLSAYLGRMNTLISNCVAIGAIPIVISICPITNFTNTQMGQIDVYNAGLILLVASYPTAKFVDARSTMGQFRAGGTDGNYWDIKTEYNSDGIHFTAAGYAALANKIYTDLPGLFQSGAAVGVEVSARSSTSPATKTDASGVVQKITTADVPRLVAGVYANTGLVQSAGLLTESSGGNFSPRSDMTAYSGGQMTGWVGPSTTAAGTPVYSNVAITDLTDIASAKSQRFQYTGVGGDSTASLIYRTAVTPVGSFEQNDLITFSFWARSQTGNTGFTAFATAIITDAATSGLTSINVDVSTMSTVWKRFWATGTCTHASSSRAYFYAGAAGGNASLGIGSGETLDIEIALPQIEKGIKFPTSFIPTGTFTSGNVSGAASHGGLIQITTSGAHDLVTGDIVVITGIVGTTEANHVWFAVVIDTTHFDLYGSTFSNAYTSGGTWTHIITRRADNLKYGLRGTNNRKAANETVFMRVTPVFAAAEPTADVVLISTESKDRRIEINTDGTFSGFGNLTDSGTSVATSTGTITRNTSTIYAVAMQSTGNPNDASYIAGSADGSSNNDFTAPAWTPTDTGANYFWVGSDVNGGNGFYGIIKSIAIYGETLSAANVAVVSALI